MERIESKIDKIELKIIIFGERLIKFEKDLQKINDEPKENRVQILIIKSFLSGWFVGQKNQIAIKDKQK